MIAASARESLSARAAHEAGHAAAALCLDLHPICATASTDMGNVQPRVKLSSESAIVADPNLLWRWLIFAHSGFFAELSYTIREPSILQSTRRHRAESGRKLDDHDIAGHAQQLATLERARVSKIRASTRKESKQLVSDHKELIVAIREALMHSDCLDFDALAALHRACGAPRVRTKYRQ